MSVKGAKAAIDDWATRELNLEHKEKLQNIPKSWMLRKCSAYLEEYEGCKQLGARFHQLYVYGETLSCDAWKDNYDDCRKWSASMDEAAVQRILDREEARIGKRLAAHVSNDVWEHRKAPPKDWDAPLPTHLALAAEESLLREHEDEKKLSEEELTVQGRAKEIRQAFLAQLPGCCVM